MDPYKYVGNYKLIQEDEMREWMYLLFTYRSIRNCSTLLNPKFLPDKVLINLLDQKQLLELASYNNSTLNLRIANQRPLPKNDCFCIYINEFNLNPFDWKKRILCPVSNAIAHFLFKNVPCGNLCNETNWHIQEERGIHGVRFCPHYNIIKVINTKFISIYEKSTFCALVRQILQFEDFDSLTEFLRFLKFGLSPYLKDTDVESFKKNKGTVYIRWNKDTIDCIFEFKNRTLLNPIHRTLSCTISRNFPYVKVIRTFQEIDREKLIVF